MPRFRMAQSLQTQCYPVLVEMLWDWWLNTREEHVSQVDEIFQYFRLPPRLTMVILDMLAEKHTVFTGHVLLLLRSGLSSFTLTRMYFVQFDILLQLAGSNMQRFTYLDISRSRVPYETLALTPKYLPNVTTLRLQYTTCTDDIVGSIARRCHLLENLDISYCSVTDNGVAQLAATTSFCHQSLKKLNITDTKVTVSGAALILDQLPNLTEFECHEILDVLAMACTNYPNHVYNLRTFQFGSERRSNRAYVSSQILVSQCFTIASEMLPFLDHVIVKDWNPQSSERLRPICEYNNLASLELDVQFCPFLTMVDISPILEIRGSQLESLILKQVQGIEPLLLIDSCPNLESLELRSNTYVEASEEPFGDWLGMKRLLLFGTMPASVLIVLVRSCPMLEFLDVHHSYNFTTVVTQEILLTNPLIFLQDVWFLECDSLTDDALHLFIESCTELHRMDVEYCRVSLKQHNKLIRWIERNFPCIDLELEVQSRIW